jgi:mRNA interferase ChpB
VSLDGAGCRTTGFVRCDQPRTLDFEARDARRVETLPPDLVDEVMARLATLFA